MTIFYNFAACDVPKHRKKQLAHVKSPDSPKEDTRPTRDALRRRIDEELARLGDIKISSWMMALPSPPAAAHDPDDSRPQATELELDTALGGLLLQSGARLEPTHCFHVIGPDGALLAVLRPLNGLAFVRRVVAREALADLSLHRRPAGAGTAPLGYRHTSFAALLWRCALFGPHGERLLPDAYRQLPLRLVQPPQLARALVAGRHVKLMELLQAKDRTFTEVQAITGLSTTQLSRDLAALLLVGSLVPA